MTTQACLLALCCLSSLPGVAAAATSAHGNDCKAFPGSREWPSKDVWHGFNETLGGRLLAPAPPAAVCHRGQPTYDAAQCPNVQKLWPSFEFHAQNPLSALWNQWTDWSCLPDPRAPCDSHGYPAYVIDASNAEHVKLGVDFAREHKVRLVVKNTGYDFLGRSTGPGALSIWTLQMKAIDFHAEGHFKLSGSGRPVKGNAVTVGAGALMMDIYLALEKHGQMFIGAQGPSVGITGYLSSGGHSNLSGRYGLGADTILEMEVVTPSGHVVTVNEDRDRDLFWALRGGGGSTFGVVTKITMQTYPTPRLLGVRWVAGVDAHEPGGSAFAAHVVSQFPQMIDSGLIGWSAVINNLPNPVSAPGHAPPQNVSGVWGISAILDTDDAAVADRVLKPVTDLIQAKWKGKARLWLQTTKYPTYAAYIKGVYTARPAGSGWWEVSRLMDRKAFTGDVKALGRAMEAVRSPHGNLFSMTLAGKGVQDVKPPGGGNSVNPAWRAAYALAMTALTFPPRNKTADEDASEFLNKAWQPMRDLTPDSGSFIDEGLPFEKEWQHTFWGSNYERLLKIKRQVDPDDVLWCSPCVGNERWRQRQDGHLCRVK